jgi:hypothetical protein
LIEVDRVILLEGSPETIFTPSESGKGQKISRCPTCELAVWSRYAGAGDSMLFVRVGTLDDPDQLPPDIHIYTSSKQAWIQLSADAPIVDEYYDRKEYWPAASLDRRRVLLSSSS